MTQEKDNTEPRQDLLPKGYLWKKSATPEDPSSPPQTAPEAGEIDRRLDTTRRPPEHLPKLEGKLEPSKFQTNFPQQQQQHGGQASVTEAVKTIKPEDFLNVTQTPCARNGFISGIITGGLVGGIRFVMNTPLPKTANWSVGGTLLGAIASFEYCQYQRRQERIRMKRTVEVYQESVAEKRRQEYEAKVREQEAAERQRAEEAKRKPWYKLW